MALTFVDHDRKADLRGVISPKSVYGQLRIADNTHAISNTSGWWLSVRGSSKQQQIPIWILDDEILGAPRLLFQRLVKGNTSGLKLKKQQLDLVRCSDGHRCRQQFVPIADRRLDYWSLDAP